MKQEAQKDKQHKEESGNKKTDKKQSDKPSKSWINKSKPVMVPFYVPAQRSFYDYSHDPYEFGQYQKLSSAYPETVHSSSYQRSHPNEFPYLIDEDTGGLEQRISKQFNFVQNQRWTS